MFTNKQKLYHLFFFAVLFSACAVNMAKEENTFYPQRVWNDTEGNPINAHGGGVLYYDGVYYWFGEHKADTTCSAMVGVTCYASKNLTEWENKGVALAVDADDSESDIAMGCILERPKVVYNKKTGKFVMWFHLELKDKGYESARYGVAVSDVVTGPYRFLRSGRANPGKFSLGVTAADIAALDTLVEGRLAYRTAEWQEAVRQGLYMKRDFEGGQMARDQTVFVDDDGKAYHIFSSEENLTLHIAELTDDYLYHTGRYARMAPGGENEAPAIFKKDGTYWMITSGCTGWAPNEARMFSASHIMGPWKQHPNPCVGTDAAITFGGQSTYIIKVENRKDAYIFMGDIWRPEYPKDSRYLWLPVRFQDGRPVLEWMDSWSLDYFRVK